MAPQKVYEEGDLIKFTDPAHRDPAILFVGWVNKDDVWLQYKHNDETRWIIFDQEQIYEETRRFAHHPKSKLQLGALVCHSNYWEDQSLIGHVVSGKSGYVGVALWGAEMRFMDWLDINTLLVDNYEPKTEPETTSFQPLRQRIPRPPAATAAQLGIPNNSPWKEPR
jgi:hypothetical protein